MNRPRKTRAKYLEGAPPYVLAVRDAGPQYKDRYTVFFGWPIWQPSMGSRLPYLGFAETAADGGFSQWGELNGQGGGDLIAWQDLPEPLQQHVIRRANYPTPVGIVHLQREERDAGERVRFKPDGISARNGRPKLRNLTRRVKDVFWLLISHDGQGGFGPDFRTAAEARAWAEQNNIIVIERKPE